MMEPGARPIYWASLAAKAAVDRARADVAARLGAGTESALLG